MAEWTPPTVRDRLLALRGGAAVKGDNPHTRCDCGRSVPLDMMVDLRGMDRSVREHLGITATAFCDACRERLHLTGALPRWLFAIAMGAPAAVAQKLRGVDA